MSLRPESITIGATEDVPEEFQPTSLQGQVTNVTYLGHSHVYTVAVDWMPLEVRTNATPNSVVYEPGSQVAIWWDRRSDWVVPDEGYGS